MGKYAASTFNSHIRIPYNYSRLINLQTKLNEQFYNFFDKLTQQNLKISDYDLSSLNSMFELYRGNTNEIFKLFNNLLISLPYILACQHRQWDIALFL